MKKGKTKQTKSEAVAAENVGPQVAGVTRPIDAEEGNAFTDSRSHAEAETPETVETLQAKVDKLADSLLRVKADYKNLERRSNVERSDAIRFANADLMRSLVVVVDDFERSLAASESSDNLAAVVDGVRLVHQNLIKALELQGLERIDALHQPFDPSVHEAMLLQESAEHEPGTVIEVVGMGYRLRDRVLRPAMVVVSKATEQAAATQIEVVAKESGVKDSDEDGSRSSAR